MSNDKRAFNLVWRVILPPDKKDAEVIGGGSHFSAYGKISPDASELLPELLQWAVTQAYDHAHRQAEVQRVDIMHNSIDTVLISVITTNKDMDFLSLPDRFSTAQEEVSIYQYIHNESPLTGKNSVMPWQEDIFRLCRRIMQIHNAFLDSLDVPLKKNEFVICRAVHYFPNCDQGTLVNITSIDKATLTLTVQDLREKGYIEQIVNAKDHRKRLLKLTETGKAALRESRLRAKVFPKILWDSIPQYRYAIMLSVLEEICINWDAYDKQKLSS